MRFRLHKYFLAALLLCYGSAVALAASPAHERGAEPQYQHQTMQGSFSIFHLLMLERIPADTLQAATRREHVGTESTSCPAAS
ncbi:MAG: hypothetical protein EA392_11670 [Cryomorphaceae bacterium]|nr:MAG: hypothetical protein EA392_11670 [Cryomorphaceae bacterium]